MIEAFIWCAPPADLFLPTIDHSDLVTYSGQCGGCRESRGDSSPGCFHHGYSGHFAAGSKLMMGVSGRVGICG
jgi:hypothetical protein